MRIKISKSKTATYYSIIKEININGKRTTIIYENLDTVDTIKSRAGNNDTFIWLEEYVRDLNVKNLSYSFNFDIKIIIFLYQIKKVYLKCT